MEITNKKWSEDKLFRMRKEVLNTWPTGSKVDLEEAIEYHKQILPERNAVELNRRGRMKIHIPLEKTLGRATLQDNIGHSQACAEAGADIVTIGLDTYTRKNQYRKAQAAIEASKKEKRSLLNGFPIVNYGVYESRKIIESLDIPVQIWSATDEDPRLAHEISLAAGFTEVGFSSLIDLLAHSKDYPLDKRIINDQYGNRLVAYYVEHGCPVSVYHPNGIGGFTVPDMKTAISILETLLTAEQGAKDIVINYVSIVHLTQMVATFRVFRKLMREYLDKFGHTDTSITLVYGAYDGPWPMDSWAAAAAGAWEVIIGMLADVDRIWLKSIIEGQYLPTREADVAAIKIAKELRDIIGRQRLPESDELRLEEQMQTLAVKAIVDRAIELGDGDVAIGMIKAVEQGVIDTTITCWTHVARRVLEVRDMTGAYRYLDHGNVPLPKEVADYHQQKIAEREKADEIEAGLEMLIKDVSFISREFV